MPASVDIPLVALNLTYDLNSAFIGEVKKIFL